MADSDSDSDSDSAARLRSLRREPPPFRRVRLISREQRSPRLLRVVLGGDSLEGFAIEAPASSVRLLLPPAIGEPLVMPEWAGNQFELPDGRRAPIRTFTPRHHDPERHELTLEIVLHASGAATDWAKSAAIGDEVAISGPGRSEPLDAEARSFLLAGDESAIPAISQLLETIDADRSVTVHVEVTDANAVVELPEHRGASVDWHVLRSNDEPGSAMSAAVEGMDDLPDAVWVAGEAAAVQHLRRHLFDDRGLHRSAVTARGYWKHGRSAS